MKEENDEGWEAMDKSEYYISSDNRSEAGSGDANTSGQYDAALKSKAKSSTYKEAFSKFAPHFNKSSTFIALDKASQELKTKTASPTRQLRNQRVY